MQVWLGADGRVRGVVCLGSITSEEFIQAFSRWQPTLRRIGEEEHADEVYAAVRPDVIAKVCGYRSVRITIRWREEPNIRFITLDSRFHLEA
jgi:hypothetical protein